jgi:hypothetical protein
VCNFIAYEVSRISGKVASGGVLHLLQRCPGCTGPDKQVLAPAVVLHATGKLLKVYV